MNGCDIAVPGGKPPIWNVINKDTHTQFLKEQEKVVIAWMQQNDYHLKFSFQNRPPSYILELGTTSLCAAPPNDDPAAWTKVGIEDLTLEVRLNYFIIRIKDVGEAAFTLDGEGNPLSYDLTGTEKIK